MNTLGKRVRRTNLIAGLLVLLLTTSSLAQEGQVKVPFLFSDDEKLAQTELEAIPRSSELQGDPYLNAPMTRLEYMLTRLEASLEEHRDAVRSLLSERFESSQMHTPISIDGFVRYTREHGHIVAGYTIRGLGRPKQPMRTTCDLILSVFGAPQENIGWFLHNTVLGVLMQEDASTYTPVMKILASNIVQRVNLQTTTEDMTVIHGLACQRTKAKAPIQYTRYSANLGR